MSRLEQDFIDQLLGRTDLLEVVGSRIKMKKVGKDYVGLCPFHDERSPSFMVTPGKQLYYCFGCRAAGNALNFLMDFEGMHFRVAVDELCRMTNTPAPDKKDAPAALSALREVLGWYQDRLWEGTARSREALQYLADRGVSEESARAFGLGLAPPTNVLDKRFPKMKRELVAVGLVDESDRGYRRDRMRGRLVIPIRSPHGEVIAATGRTLGGDTPKYLNTSVTEWFQKDKTLFGLDVFRRETRSSSVAPADRIDVVEGPMDVVVLHSKGIHSVGALGSSLGIEQFRVLLGHARRVSFCFDGDASGMRSAEDSLGGLLPIGVDAARACFRALPENEDPASLVRSSGADALHRVAEKEFFDFWLSLLPPPSENQGLALADAGIEWLQKMRDPLLQESALRALSERSGYSVEALSERLGEVSRRNTARARGRRSTTEKKGPDMAPVPAPLAALWRILLESPLTANDLVLSQQLRKSSDPALRAIVECFIAPVSDEAATRAALSRALADLSHPGLVRAIHELPAPDNALAEAQAALSAIEEGMVRTLVDGYIERLRKGGSLSDEEQAELQALMGAGS